MQKEQKTQENVFELSKRLWVILDEVLTTGDWQSSSFLKTAAIQLRDLQEKCNKLSLSSGGNKAATEVINVDKDTTRRAIVPGYARVFILLYQVDGANLQSWYRTIRTLAEHSITHQIYKEENHVKEAIRAKITDQDRNGYAVVDIKEENLLSGEQPLDQFGHALCVLKDSSVKLENIIEFVHNNRKRYALHDNELFFLSELY